MLQGSGRSVVDLISFTQPITRTDFPSNSLVGPAGNTDESGTITYEITGLPSGTYNIRARVDETGNGYLADSGDFDGWYNETVTVPITDWVNATDLVISGSVTGSDFGLGYYTP